jgi:preprotein translocase subunit SecA
VILSVLDRKWREHLYEMDYLRDGIGLRAMAQRDPLIEYQREGYDLFSAMMDAIKEETVGFLFNVDVQVTPAEGAAPVAVTTEQAAATGAAALMAAKGLTPNRPKAVEYTGPTEQGGVEHHAGTVDGDDDSPLDSDASRAERRRAERAKRKKR